MRGGGYEVMYKVICIGVGQQGIYLEDRLQLKDIFFRVEWEDGIERISFQLFLKDVYV